jgi:glycosyltransferase involved in cell wall biosynthesis
MVRLVVVTDCLSRNAGGTFNSIRRLAQEMHKGPCQVSVLGVADSATEADLHHWEPIHPRALSRLGPGFFGYAPGLVDAIKQQRPDVIQVHGLWKYTSIAALRVHNAIGCPYTVHPHGMLDPWAVRNSRWKKMLASLAYERCHLDRASCIRALCRSEAEAIRAYGVRTPVCVIPNAIDLPAGAGGGESIPSPYPPDRRILLYLGRIHPKKGLVNLLDAWSFLQKTLTTRERSNPWILAIAGWDQGGHESRLRGQVSALGLQDSVVFLGPRFHARKAACYQYCDALVLPSFSEGLPMVVLEAWAHSKPVLMTGQCNLPEGFNAGAALKIEPSPESIACGARAMFEMTDVQRNAVGRRGLALVKERFTWTEAARLMVEVQTWLLHGGAAPACVEVYS